MLLIGMVWGTCVQVWGAVSRWSWRGYPSEAALRTHLKTSSNHPYITDREVDAMNFEQLIAYHEKDHIRRKDKPRWSRARKVPGSSDSTPAPPRQPAVTRNGVIEQPRSMESNMTVITPLNGRWQSSYGILDVYGDRFEFLGGPQGNESLNSGNIIVRGNTYTLQGRETRSGVFAIQNDILILTQTSPTRMSQQLRRL